MACSSGRVTYWVKHVYYTLLTTVTGWYCTKLPMHCGHVLIYSESPSAFLSLLTYPPVLSGRSRDMQKRSGELVRNAFEFS
jgi:hypothetical protein